MNVDQQSELEVARQEAQELLFSLEEQKPRADHEVTSVVNRALQKLKTVGADEEEKMPWIYEVRLWMSSPFHALSQKNQVVKPLKLTERFGESVRDHEFFPPESDLYFEERFEQSHNSFLKARYADFLAVRCSLDNTEKNAARHWILKAVPLYLLNVMPLVASPEIHHQIEAFEQLDSAAHLALCKAPELLPSVSAVIRQFLNIASQEVTITDDGHPIRYGRWSIEAGNILLGIRKHTENAVTDSDLEWWQMTAQSLARQNFGLDEPLIEQSFWTQTAQAAALRGQKSEQFAALNECADAKIREAHTRSQGQNASALAAAGLMENAVEYLDHLRGYAATDAERQDIAEKQRRLKLEIRRFYFEGKKEIGWSWVPFDISTEQIEAATAPFLEPSDLKECLQRLGSRFLPNLQEAEKWAQSRMGDEFITSLVGTSLMGDGLEIRAYNSEAEKLEFERNRAYEFQFHLNNKILLPVIWEKLRLQKSLNASSLLGYLDASGLLGERNYRLVQVGIERYFAEDFAAALHLLVPQLEDVIRGLFERAGVPPTKQSKGGNGWEFETFGAFLRRIDKELRDILPTELRVYVERILSDPTGWNLRNQVAHGLISFGECNRVTTETVLHIYLSFSLFEETPKVEKDHVTTVSYT